VIRSGGAFSSYARFAIGDVEGAVPGTSTGGAASGTMPVASRSNISRRHEDELLDHSDRTTILVVEDEALIQMVSAEMLSDAGFRVLEAQNADEAIAIMESADDVELLFADIRMPGRMDGLELAIFVHAHWPDVRLLVTSGHAILDDSEIPDDGRFVGKPYDLRRLVLEIHSLISLPPVPAA